MNESNEGAKEAPTGGSGSPELAARFSRVVDFLGEDGFRRLRSSSVAVFGLGGVGSHAALALARGGVGRLRLVDFDVVSASSLNRHAVAGPADVGRPKATVVAERLAELCPDTAVEADDGFFHDDSADRLLGGPLDFVADAIDSLTPKVALLRAASLRRIPIASSLGASAKIDPSKIRVGDLFESSGCPLARAVRRRLGRLGIRSGITAVWSTERGREALPPDAGDAPRRPGRVRNRLPSLPSMPGIFGYALAGVILERLAGGPDSPEAEGEGSTPSPAGL